MKTQNLLGGILIVFSILTAHNCLYSQTKLDILTSQLEKRILVDLNDTIKKNDLKYALDHDYDYSNTHEASDVRVTISDVKENGLVYEIEGSYVYTLKRFYNRTLQNQFRITKKFKAEAKYVLDGFIITKLELLAP